MNSFGEFIDKKSRETRKQLGIVRDLLEKHGMQVQDFTESDDDDPYLFLKNTQGDSSFAGVRIYRIGNMIAYRVQKEQDTHPYGTAYALKIPDMFRDLITDQMKEEEAGNKVIESVLKEFQKFFTKSAAAERDVAFDDRAGVRPLFGSTIPIVNHGNIA